VEGAKSRSQWGGVGEEKEPRAGYEVTVKGLAFLAAAAVQRGRREERTIGECEGKQDPDVRGISMGLVRWSSLCR
jgi:hypothetical protein